MSPSSFLRPLGVYGYDSVEPVILAALLTQDPLLLIGLHGTGKTFLLNSLSEALGLEHRHYNASLISFDDLVGFPYPDQSGEGIRYLPTPATVWSAESILIDEINRCRPEHQNRFFSLINERRIQGMPLAKLRYRWAAMNPAGEENGYHGTEPLDPALADRFAFIVRVADWAELSEADRRSITDPRGDGAVSRDGGRLREFLAKAAPKFAAAMAQPPDSVLDYSRIVATTLGEARLRLSPRRTRQLARNLLAATIVSNLPTERLFRLVLETSTPQVASGEKAPHETLAAAHRIAWDAVALNGREKWLHAFSREPDLAAKARLLFTTCPDPDTGSVAVAQLLASESPPRRLAFTLAVTPRLLAAKNTPVGTEGLADLSNIMAQASHQDAAVLFRQDVKNPHRNPSSSWLPKGDGVWTGELPGYHNIRTIVEALPPRHRTLAAQFIDAVIVEQKELPAEPQPMIDEFVRVVDAMRRIAA